MNTNTPRKKYLIDLELKSPLGGEKIKRFLYQQLQGSTRYITHNSIEKWIRESYILVNDKMVKKNYRLAASDVITIRVPYDLSPADMPDIPVIYEDQHLMVLDKPARLKVESHMSDIGFSLVHVLEYLYPYLKSLPRAGIVHRLDQDTTGLLLVAKNTCTLEYLQNMLQRRLIKRSYLALVHRAPRLRAGVIENYLKKNHLTRKMQITSDSRHRKAITYFVVKQLFLNHALLECTLGTGRTHQIRVHLASMHCPIVADKLYSRFQNGVLNIDRQALHAYKLDFTHLDGTQISLSSPIPEDFLSALQQITPPLK